MSLQIGDDKKQDVGAIPREMNLRRYLVKTGKYRTGDELLTEAGGPPDWVGATFSDAVQDILSEL